jgi:hypothetical protein
MHAVWSLWDILTRWDAGSKALAAEVQRIAHLVTRCLQLGTETWQHKVVLCHILHSNYIIQKHRSDAARHQHLTLM